MKVFSVEMVLPVVLPYFRRRRQNFILLQERLKERKQEQELKDKKEVERIQRKFRKARSHYLDYRSVNSQAFG